jgi:hypothetical protein
MIPQERIDELVEKLRELINKEIDQDIFIDTGKIDPKDAVDYKARFKKIMEEELKKHET